MDSIKILRPKISIFLFFLACLLLVVSVMLFMSAKKIDVYGSNTLVCVDFLKPFSPQERLISSDVEIEKTSALYVQCKYSPWATIIYNCFVFVMAVIYWFCIGYIYRRFVRGKHVVLKGVYYFVALLFFSIFILFLFFIGFWMVASGSNLMANP